MHSKAQFKIFYYLLTVPRTVSTRMLKWRRCSCVPTHPAIITCSALRATWYEGTAQLLSLTQLNRIYFSIIILAEPLTDEGGVETGVPGENPWGQASELRMCSIVLWCVPSVHALDTQHVSPPYCRTTQCPETRRYCAKVVYHKANWGSLQVWDEQPGWEMYQQATHNVVHSRWRH